ncbi:sugar transferase [Bacillaceae bacterium Marseille-Q3522]|nr:sugar transferase [Bacillaceae bacterium Marseille-Q3522]
MADPGYKINIPQYNADEYKTKKQQLNNTSFFYNKTKRLIDIIGSLVGLLFVGIVYIAIRLFYFFGEAKGPVLFKQKRFGKDGRQFDLYKFRSMCVDADKKLKANKLMYEKYLKNNYKLEPEEDPRITRFGRFLRKTSLDELPQLINVLKGDMSLVGPRPVVEEELMEYKNHTSDFLSVKPGMTGFWQVSGRSDIGYPERVDLELYYVYNQSMKFDFYILFKTVLMVILRKGAY